VWRLYYRSYRNSKNNKSISELITQKKVKNLHFGFVSFVFGYVSYVFGYFLYVLGYVTYVFGYVSYVFGYASYVFGYVSYVFGHVSYVFGYVLYNAQYSSSSPDAKLKSATVSHISESNEVKILGHKWKVDLLPITPMADFINASQTCKTKETSSPASSVDMNQISIICNFYPWLEIYKYVS